MTVAKPTTDMRFRVPCWSEHALVRIGQAAAASAPPCAFYNISRQQLLDQLPAISGADAVSINITFVNKIRLHGNGDTPPGVYLLLLVCATATPTQN